MSLEAGSRYKISSPIDIHAHLREPGGTEKETIASGTKAALAGGYQAVFDMPNNPGIPTHSRQRLEQKYDIAQKDAETDIGFYAGVDLENPDLEEMTAMVGLAAGLKLYLGHTTGNTKEFGLDQARPAIDAWVKRGRWQPHRPPILLHAREKVGAEVADYIAGHHRYPVHWCHIASAGEADDCRRLWQEHGKNFTAGVTPHHLTMTARDADFKYGWPGARMMPPLGSEADGEALVDAFNRGWLQILETDHAPHTNDDKLKAETKNPTGDDGPDCTTCFGISGIEFVLPIMISLVKRRQIKMHRLVDALFGGPASLLDLDTQGSANTTAIMIEPYVIGEDDRVGQSQNHPYVGWTAWGRIEEVVSRGLIRYRYDQPEIPEARAWRPRVLRPGAKL